MKNLLKTALIITSLVSLHASADIAVIVNPNNSADLDSKSIKKIFLAKVKHFPDGSTIEPFMLSDETSEMKVFNKEVLRKSPAQLNSYWSRMIFSSSATPPTVIDSPDEVKKMVASNPNAIGIVDSSMLDDSVKVILTIPQ